MADLDPGLRRDGEQRGNDVTQPGDTTQESSIVDFDGSEVALYSIIRVIPPLRYQRGVENPDTWRVAD